MTRSLSSGIPKTREKFVRMPCGPCDAVHMVVPSGRTSATAQDGPSEAWLWHGHVYNAENCFDAAASVAAGSPLLMIASSRSRALSRTWRSRLLLPGSPCESLHSVFSVLAAFMAAHSSGATTPIKL